MAKRIKTKGIQGSQRLEIQSIISKYNNFFEEEEILISVLPKLKINQKPWIEAMKQIIKDYEN